ncbi:MAG: hypothetical protein M3096_06720 [Actinomycetia bacterium]|nr:hypothetical protein [Actinomycetes bacterium]
MTIRYTIGGVAFSTDEDLPGLPTEGFADGELDTSFLDSDSFRALAPANVTYVCGPDGLNGAIDASSNRCWLPDSFEEPADRAWQLRQMAPIFSALTHRLVLHAGAVEADGAVIAFIGPSGAGKSTLVRFLSTQRHRFVSDDLLPIRFTPAPSAPVAHDLTPISALFFLVRSDTRDVDPVRLEDSMALQSLIANGFGEHGDPSSWAFQFDAYHRIAASIPVYGLTIPDELSSLPLVDEVLGKVTENHQPSATNRML